MYKQFTTILITLFIFSFNLVAYAGGHFSTPEFISARIQLATGTDMHYVAKKAINKIHSSRATILLHGYSDSWRSFEEMLKLLPIEELPDPVFALDMRGHGESSAPGSYTQDDFSADIAAFMRAFSIREAVLIGHSMGSLIAHKFAIEYPDKVRALILLGSTSTMSNHPVVLELKPIVDTFDNDEPADPEFVLEFQASTFYSPVEPWIIYRYVSESLKLRGAVWKQTLDGLNVEDHTSQLSDITAPTLILWGDQDPVFGLQEQLELNALIPNSTLVIYSDTGHAVNVERAKEVVEDIKAFVSEHMLHDTK
jgi:pimeloyl-ACP methyl ester carboxylesterase